MHLFFSTPIWTFKIDNYEEVNEEIYNFILNLKKQDPKGIRVSNINGWHSQNFDLKSSTISRFVNLISPNINTVLNDMNWETETQVIKLSNMWAIINEKDGLNERHHHGNSAISAAYYVRAPEGCGDIVFYDPRPAPIYSHPIAKGPNSLNAQVNSIKPQEGSLILFPSYLDHSVNPNISNKQRIVVSFNILLNKK